MLGIERIDWMVIVLYLSVITGVGLWAVKKVRSSASFFMGDRKWGKVMMAFEQVLFSERPDLVVVVGDVNSTMACTITAKKLAIAVAHVEAGLRSRDMTMPEEINRMCTDVLADYLFTTDTMANDNLLAEGVADSRIFFVGNVMKAFLQFS